MTKYEAAQKVIRELENNLPAMAKCVREYASEQDADTRSYLNAKTNDLFDALLDYQIAQ